MTDIRPTLRMPVLVEGKYDKIKLESLFRGVILTTDGFGLFKRKDKQAFLRRLADEGLIVLTDPDGGGTQIRSFLRGILPPERVVHLYVPRLSGKEPRKKQASRSGTLGVEGMENDLLRRLLMPYTDGAPSVETGVAVTKADLYADGFSGGAGSAERRNALCRTLGLPEDMNANALVEVINLLGGRAIYTEAREKAISEPR